MNDYTRKNMRIRRLGDLERSGEADAVGVQHPVRRMRGPVGGRMMHQVARRTDRSHRGRHVRHLPYQEDHASPTTR